MFLLTRETSCEGLTLILTFVFSKTEFITVICGETVIHTAEQNRASQHRRHFLTSAPFLLDLLHFSDVLFFFLLDFKDVCRQEDKHISTSDFVCVCVCVCVCVYLCSADPDDPGGRDDDGSVSSQRAALLDLLQHEARHLVVILKHKQEVTS